MRGHSGFGRGPILRPGRPIFFHRMPFFSAFGCLGMFFPFALIGLFVLSILARFIR